MTKTIKVLHISTHNEECGIAKYQEQFIESMTDVKEVEHVFFDVSPNKSKIMSASDYSRVLEKLDVLMPDFDIIHIQHELSFYKHKELQSIIDLAHKHGKKVMVTIHTGLSIEYKDAAFGLSPRAMLHFLRTKRARSRFERVHLNPLLKSDLMIVHNQTTRDDLVKHGFSPERVKVITMPVPKISFDPKSSEIHQALNYQKGDVIYSTVGFVTQSKGVDHAVKALMFLPKNYKLAIIGGIHPNSTDASFLDHISDYIVQNKLQDRVYIVGYVEDDETLNALIRECDICVYAYDKKYYSYVSSASLSNAFANYKPTVAYKTPPLLEINESMPVVNFCKSPNYYELAREIKQIDISDKAAIAEKYAKTHAYDKEAVAFAEIYQELTA